MDYYFKKNEDLPRASERFFYYGGALNIIKFLFVFFNSDFLSNIKKENFLQTTLLIRNAIKGLKSIFLQYLKYFHTHMTKN